MSRIALLLQTALNATSNGVVISDNTLKDNPIIYANPGFERMTGYDLSEIVGHNCRFLQGERTDPDTVNRLRQAIQNGVPTEVELLNYKKDGTPFWNGLSVSPVRDENGIISHFIGVQSDITDRKEKEKAQDQQAMVQSILDTLDHPLLLLNENLTVHLANQSFYRLFQTGTENIVGRHISTIEKGVFNAPALQTLIERVLPENIPFDGFELTHDFSSLGTKTFSLKGRRLSYQGRLKYILLKLEEITDKKIKDSSPAERELGATRAIAGLSRIAIVTLNQTGYIQSWNPGAEHVTGHTANEIKGQPISVLFAESDFLEGWTEAEMRRAIREGQSSSERWLKHKDGSLYWALCELNPLRNDSGHLQGFVLLINEQTERKHWQDELIQRTEDLTGRDRAKDEFMAMLGHELRNPLSAISSAAEVTKMLGNTEVQRPLEIVLRQSKNMTRLVNDLLDVARVTQGKIVLQSRLTSLDAIVSSVAHNLVGMAQAKGLNLTSEIEPSVMVQGDGVRLEQIINNLVTNAIKYTTKGEVRVYLQRSGNRAVLRVSDTGIGIDAELRPRLFELFSQSKRGLAHSEGGLGIGLTIVKQLVDLHSGTVEVESAGVGLGSTFVVSFPLDKNQKQEQDELAIALDINSRRTILVVEDNLDTAEMTAVTLELWGYRVWVAHNGAEAMDIARQEHPPIVLLDIDLPDVDGYQIAEQLQQEYGAKTIKLIATTGYAQQNDVERILNAGFDAHFAKPLPLSSLREKLHSYEEDHQKRT